MVWLLSVLLSFVFGAPAGQQRAAACSPPSGRSVLPTPLPHLAGSWSIEQRGKASASESFRMQLRATDSASQSFISPMDRKLHRETSFLYYGVIERNDDTSTYRRNQEYSWDPGRPGVKASFFPQYSPSFRFTIGSEKNDRSRLILDGYDFWLNVHSLSDSTMMGNWSSGVWVIGQVDSGWWCAKRVP